MNQITSPQGGLVIFFSIMTGLILTIAPFPDWADQFRPPWISLIAIYWAMSVPHKFGLIFAWLTGLSLDIVTGGLLGQHAMGLSIIIFLVLQLHLRLRLFPLWQQSVAIFILLLIEHLLTLWITSIAYGHVISWAFWYPTLLGMFLWPWIFVIMRDLRRRFKVN